MFDLNSLAPRIGDVFIPDPPYTFLSRPSIQPQVQMQPQMQIPQAFHIKDDYNQQCKKYSDIVSKSDKKMEKRIRDSLKETGGDFLVNWEEKEAKRILGETLFDILRKFCEQDFIICGYRMFYEGGSVHCEKRRVKR